MTTYKDYKRLSREDLIKEYSLNKDQQTYLLDELLAIEDYVYENYINVVPEEKTAQYRDQLFRDAWNDVTPKRVPINQNLNSAYAIEYAGFSMLREQFSLEKHFEAYEKLAQKFTTDVFPVGVTQASNIVANTISGGLSYQMDKEGFLQHPDLAPMKDDEYAYAIGNFTEFLKDINIRMRTKYQVPDNERALVELRSLACAKRFNEILGEKRAAFVKKHNCSTFEKQTGVTGSPFDSIANGLRSFKGVLIDIRRQPENVLALTELYTQQSLDNIPRMAPPAEGNRVFMPLHLATFMKQKDFEKFYWPFFKRVVDAIDESGRRMHIFFESDWTRYMDYLELIPDKTLMAFESTDAALAKARLGKNHILTGFYPQISYMCDTKEQAEKRVKGFLDIVAPGGNYFFKSDKTPLKYSDANIDVLNHIINTVMEYGKY